jgi:N-acetylneuraminic acid mutarotase
MMKRRTLLVIAASLTLSVGFALAQPRAGRWRREPDLLAPRAAHAIAATANALYVLGGTGPDGRPVMDVERFDGKVWTRETSLPGEGVNAPAAAAIGDNVFLIGGFGTTTNRPIADMRRYNTRTHEWTEMAALPAPRGGHAAIVMDGRIHVIGGGNSTSTINDHSIYDPRTNTWTDGAPLPRSLGSPAAVVLDNKLYSIGGRSGPNDFGDVYVYDPFTKAWTPGVSIDPRGTGGAAVIGESIYYFGGESQAKSIVLDEVLRLDRGATQWVRDTSLPTGRNFARSVAFKDRIYVIGGSTTYGRSHASPGSGVVESFGR